mmetsp:Transcript_31333/g.65712  ORF Transcript_31333/g.65712 Transcript_31333/m.65712 type:complete len:85 (-) Transcript_31333:582-836(-)
MDGSYESKLEPSCPAMYYFGRCTNRISCENWLSFVRNRWPVEKIEGGRGLTDDDQYHLVRDPHPSYNMTCTDCLSGTSPDDDGI